MWIKDEYPGEKPDWLTAEQWEAWFDGGFVRVNDDLADGPHSKIARHGSLAVLQWAAAQGYPLDKDNDEFGLCTIAAERGHLEMLQWARAQGCQWGPGTCCSAAYHGHIEILDHLRDHGCEFPKDDGVGILTFAARGGHIDVLKWGLEHGCEWHIKECFWAARHGHLEALKYMRSKGAPWDKEHCAHYATHLGHPETAQWIAAQTTVLAGDQ